MSKYEVVSAEKVEDGYVLALDVLRKNKRYYFGTLRTDEDFNVISKFDNEFKSIIQPFINTERTAILVGAYPDLKTYGII
jgi:hypothetical protein